MSEFICGKLLERLVLPNFRDKLKVSMNTPIQTRFEVINCILNRFHQTESGKLAAEELVNGMAGATTYLQLLQIPIEIFSSTICKLIGTDADLSEAVGKLASVFSSAGIGLVMAGTSGLLMSILLWILSEFTAWFITKVLARIIGELQTENLLEGATVEVVDMVVSIMNYIYACVLSADNWVTLMKEKSEELLRRNSGLAETLAPIEMNLIS